MSLGERAQPEGTHAHIRVGGPSTEPIDVGEGDWGSLPVFNSQLSTAMPSQPLDNDVMEQSRVLDMGSDSLSGGHESQRIEEVMSSENDITEDQSLDGFGQFPEGLRLPVGNMARPDSGTENRQDELNPEPVGQSAMVTQFFSNPSLEENEGQSRLSDDSQSDRQLNSAMHFQQVRWTSSATLAPPHQLSYERLCARLLAREAPRHHANLARPTPAGLFRSHERHHRVRGLL